MRRPYWTTIVFPTVAVLVITACNLRTPELMTATTPSPVHISIATVQETSTLAPTSLPTSTPPPTVTQTPSPTPTSTTIPLSEFPVIGAENIEHLAVIDSFETKIDNAHYFDIKGKFVSLGGGWYNDAELWDVQSRSLVRNLAHEEYGIFHPTMDFIAVASPRSTEPTVSLQEIGTGREIAVFGEYSHKAYEASWINLEFSPDGKYLAASIAIAQRYGDESFPIMIWDTLQGKAVGKIATPYMFSLLPTFGPDGSKLAYYSVGVLNEDRPTVTLVQFPALTRVWQRKLSRPKQMVFAPNGKTLAVVTTSQILILDVTNGNILHQLDVTGGAVDAVYSPDSRTLTGLIGGSMIGNALRVYDVETGKTITTIFGVRALGITLMDNGRTLIAWNWTAYNASIGYTRFDVSWYRAAP